MPTGENGMSVYVRSFYEFPNRELVLWIDDPDQMVWYHVKNSSGWLSSADIHITVDLH